MVFLSKKIGEAAAFYLAVNRKDQKADEIWLQKKIVMLRTEKMGKKFLSLPR